MPDLIALTCVSHSPAWLEEMARAYSGEHAALLERRILEGENRIDLPYLPDVMGERDVPRRVVYLVPLWWRRPRDRLKVERARWRWRRRRVPRERLGDPLEGEEDGRDRHHPQALTEVDLRGVPMTHGTAVANGRRMINEYRLLDLPVAHPVVLLWTDVNEHERTTRLP